MALHRGLPVRQAAALLRCNDKQLRVLIQFYVDQARALDGFESVQIVGIDETSARRGQRSITVMHDFAADLTAYGGDPAGARHVCMDMSWACVKGAGMALPQADISDDRGATCPGACARTRQVGQQGRPMRCTGCSTRRSRAPELGG